MCIRDRSGRSSRTGKAGKACNSGRSGGTHGSRTASWPRAATRSGGSGRSGPATTIRMAAVVIPAEGIGTF